MITLLCISASSFLVCLLLMPLAQRLARRFGLVDAPDGRRKIHGKITPVTGGLAILVAGSLATTAALLVPNSLLKSLHEQLPWLLGLFLAALVICAVGVADDYGCLRGRHKLAGQCAAIGVLLCSGVLVSSIRIFGVHLELGILAVPFTLFILLGAINSLNLIDGMDGLLGSVGFIVSLALAAMAALSGHWAAAVLAIALAGALAGFLCYNLPPASIFLGDSGSMLVGLVLGTLAIQSSLKAPATITLALPVVLLTLPIFDTAVAIVRRKFTGRSLFTTDRGHLHHCLLRSGLSVWRVLGLVAGCCLLTGLGVLASQAFDNEIIALLTGAAVVAILMTTRVFGYVEAQLIKERFRSLGLALFQRGLAPVRQSEVRLQGTANWRELWRALTASALQLNLKKVRLDVNAPSLHEGYHASWDCAAEEGEAPSLWRAEIPLTNRGLSVGRLEIAGQPDHEPVWLKIATMTKVVEAYQHVVTRLDCGSHENQSEDRPQPTVGKEMLQPA